MVGKKSPFSLMLLFLLYIKRNITRVQINFQMIEASSVTGHCTFHSWGVMPKSANIKTTMTATRASSYLINVRGRTIITDQKKNHNLAHAWRPLWMKWSQYPSPSSCLSRTDLCLDTSQCQVMHEVFREAKWDWLLSSFIFKRNLRLTRSLLSEKIQ